MLTYSDNVKEHFINPRNVGEIAAADAVGESGSMSSGQALTLSLKIDEDEIIRDAKFRVFGSPGAIAASSALTEMLKGKHIDEAARLTADDIAEYLGGLPPEKMHTCVMSMEALEDAYARFRGIELEAAVEDDDELYLCRCYSIPEHKIERAVRDHNLSTIEEIAHYTKAGAGCTTCHRDLENILARVRADMPGAREEAKPTPVKTSGGSDLEKMQAIQEVLDREVRPGLAMDGGDMELVDVRGNKVFVELQGHCNSCMASSTTMKFFVQDRLREMIDPEIEVIDTTEHSEELHAPPMR